MFLTLEHETYLQKKKATPQIFATVILSYRYEYVTLQEAGIREKKPKGHWERGKSGLHQARNKLVECPRFQENKGSFRFFLSTQFEVNATGTISFLVTGLEPETNYGVEIQGQNIILSADGSGYTSSIQGVLNFQKTIP